MNDTKKQAAAVVAKYGAEALEHLRAAETMLTMVAALGRLEGFAWRDQAGEWQRAVQSVVAQVEDTDLSGNAEEVDYKALPTREAIACAGRDHKTVYLMVQRADGTREGVLYEPYGFRRNRHGEYLWCYNAEHRHPECLLLDAILYLSGVGGEFEPRFEVEF